MSSVVADIDSRAEADSAARKPYRALGYNQGEYFYLARGTGQVRSLTPSGHQKNQLISLAPLAYWETAFPDRKSADWGAAADHLMRECEAEGVFDPTRLRGRGCWREDGTIVVHLGDRLVVDGSEYPVSRYPSRRAIYEEARPIQGPSDAPLTSAEGRQLIDIIKLVRWEAPSDALLFAGLTVLAPICGALTWRPHGWIVGSAGTGKTWLISNIMRPLMGDLVHHVQSETTEAGIRQLLYTDAIPVIFDEAEGNERKDKDRIQSVLGLMRQASSESGACLVKGSSGGDAISYQVRSTFILASVGSGVKQTADATRITVMTLRPPHKDDYSERQRAWHELKERASQITTETGRRLVARTIRLLPTILANTETFTDAAAKHLGSQRLGDQYGALLAAAYSLISDSRVTPELARKVLNQYDWTQNIEQAQTRDELKCLQYILQRQLQVDGHNTRTNMSVSELVAIATGDEAQNENVDRSLAETHLRRIGIRPRQGGVAIANNGDWLERALADTPYSNGWPSVLQRLDGAYRSGTSVRFGPYHVARAVVIDLERALGGGGD